MRDRVIMRTRRPLVKTEKRKKIKEANDVAATVEKLGWRASRTSSAGGRKKERAEEEEEEEVKRRLMVLLASLMTFV